MPESKKLSELINNLINVRNHFNDRVHKTTDFGELDSIRNDQIKLLNQIDQKFEELRCSCEKHKLKEWKESLSLFEQVMESKKKEYPLFEGKNEFYSSEENARKGIQEIKEILFRRGDEIQKRMLEIIYDANSKRDSKKSE